MAIAVKAAEDEVTPHELYAKLPALRVTDDKRLTFPFQSRDFRLTDAGGDGTFAAPFVNE